MRFIEQRPSGKDKNIPVFVLSMGKQELEILQALAEQAILYTPHVLETAITVSRLRNIAKVLRNTIRSITKRK